MTRCPYCGSRLLRVVGDVRDKRNWLHRRKLGNVYQCCIGNRRFDYREEAEGYLSDFEKEEIVQKLKKLGLVQQADKTARIQSRIHRKSRLGQLFKDLTEATSLPQSQRGRRDGEEGLGL